MNTNTDELGTKSIKQLLIKQAVPSSIGILFMSVNILIDTIFVGQWIGSLAIAAVTVVLPITFLISSLGMAIGVGGSSVLSRALGANDKEKALQTFGNQITMTFILASTFVIIGLLFSDEMLLLFGAKGAILQPAQEFYYPIIISVPFLALCMMGNNVIRAEGEAKFAMVAMIIPAFVNIGLDILFIKYFKMGLLGAAVATAISYTTCFMFIAWYFVFKSQLKLQLKHLIPYRPVVNQITSLSIVTFSRQGVVSLLSILLNHTLYTYGGEHSVAIYGIISRMLMFALFPILGITQGFLPIAGYNYGASNFARVKESVQLSILYAAVLATLIFVVILIFAEPIVCIFTTDPAVIAQTPNALRWVFAASPIIAIQLIGAAYFQAIGNTKKALLLTLSKQGFFLIPLVLILPNYLGVFSVWIAFSIADVFATILTGHYLKKRNNHKTDLNKKWNIIIT